MSETKTAHMAKDEKAEREAAINRLAGMVGHHFHAGEVKAKIVAFERSHDVRGKRGPAFLVNFGNPHRSDYLPAEEFLTRFKLTEG